MSPATKKMAILWGWKKKEEKATILVYFSLVAKLSVFFCGREVSGVLQLAAS